MTEEMDFDAFENLEDLDWGELEKDIQSSSQGRDSSPAAIMGKSPSIGMKEGRLGGHEQVQIGYLLDVNLQVIVEVGKTNTYISNVLGWDKDSIIELDRLVGEPLDLLINGKQVAKGEVVVVNEKFALKITEILDPDDRLAYLQS